MSSADLVQTKGLGLSLVSSMTRAANRVVVPPAFAGAGCCACNRVSSWHSAPSSSAARAGCAIERLDLAFLVDAEDHRMGRRIDLEANDILELVGEFGIVRNLERAHPMRLK